MRTTPRRRLAGVLATALMLALAAGPGCRRASSGNAGDGESLDLTGTASPEAVIRAYRSNLVVVQARWEERGLLIGRWSPRGQEGTGLIVAGDGRTALVLTSRAMIDPRYGPDGASRVRNVDIHVGVTEPDGGRAWTPARVVAVYVHDADLALLRIDAPAGRPAAMAVMPASALQVGDGVIFIGPPSERGLVHGEGVVDAIEDDPRLGSGTMRIRVTDGRPATAGVVFTRRGGRLVGVLRGQKDAPPGEIGDLVATCADALLRPDFWSYLLDEYNTRRLLSRLR